MRVVLDARCLVFPLHGIARYTRNLIQNLPLAESDQLWVLYHPMSFQAFEQKGVTWIPWQGKTFSLLSFLELYLFLKENQVDLFHSPSFLCPPFLPCPWILTLHDLIHVQRTEDYTFLHRLYFAWLQKKARQAAGLLTVSEVSRELIRTWLGPQAPAIEVSTLGVEAHFTPRPENPYFRKRYGLPREYWLFIGNHKAHKNFKLLKQLWQQAHDLPVLVTLGLPELNLPGILNLPGLEDQDLPELYSHALGLLAPSLTEGFGLPPLEALACGVPVLAADIPVFHEVLKGAASYFDPLSPSDLEQKVRQFKPHRSERRPALAYSWQNLGSTTYAFYRRCYAA